MNLTREQIEGWKMNNGAMSPNEFRALCDLALARSENANMDASCCGELATDGPMCAGCPVAEPAIKNAAPQVVESETACTGTASPANPAGAASERADKSRECSECGATEPSDPKSCGAANCPYPSRVTNEREGTLLQRLRVLYLLQTNVGDGETVAEAIDAIARSSTAQPKGQYDAMAWGDRIADKQLDELLERAKDSRTVLLRIDQFRDLVRQAKSIPFSASANVDWMACIPTTADGKTCQIADVRRAFLDNAAPPVGEGSMAGPAARNGDRVGAAPVARWIDGVCKTCGAITHSCKCQHENSAMGGVFGFAPDSRKT